MVTKSSFLVIPDVCYRLMSGWIIQLPHSLEGNHLEENLSLRGRLPILKLYLLKASYSLF